jgi:hypothetical protein
MSCTDGGTTSLDSTLARFDKLFYDKFTLLCIYIVILFVFIFMLYYFIKDLIKIISEHYREKAYSDPEKPNKNGKVDPNRDSDNPKDKDADDEIYLVDGESIPNKAFTAKAPVIPTDHKDPNEKRFINNLNTKYSEYNAQKTKYIEKNFNNKENDDIINEKILYSKYDDYEYQKESKYD